MLGVEGFVGYGAVELGREGDVLGALGVLFKRRCQRVLEKLTNTKNFLVRQYRLIMADI